MAAKATALPLLLAAGLCLLLLRGIVVPAGAEQGAFLAPQQQGAAAERSQAVGSPAAAVLPAFAAAAVPGLAEAATEQELNRFGFVFAIFWLGAFVAGLARMLTTGKL
mmetsp:Transcript_53221/g.170506  ORF Transcript_53221/g.170506 Transcript_53221/m.170506 type:complete len:108 (+) Transcript_53221:64-387(+)